MDLSLDLFVSVPQYQSLVRYFSDMACICPYIIPVKITSKKKLQKEYSDCCYLLEKMNIETEFRKIITNVIRDGVFFGYEIETEDSYTIKHLNPRYCRVVGTNDGAWCFEFDFSFFTSKRKRGTNKLLLESYPEEFKKLYKLYLQDRVNNRWQQLNVDKQVCIRYFPELNSPYMDFPPYCNLFEDIINMIDFKAMNKLKTQMDSYKFLALVMETSNTEDGMNKFKVDPDLVSDYYNFLAEECGDAITPFISPVPVQEIQFTSSNKEIDQVANSLKAFWNASGVSDTQFGTGIKSGTGLSYSVQVDENRLSNIFNQIETFLSRKMKRQDTKNIFKVKVPQVTKFNRDATVDRLLNTAQYGISSKNELLAVLGYSPSEVEGLLMLENEIMDLVNRLVPLQSSHTQSGNEESNPDVSGDGSNKVSKLGASKQKRTKGRPNVENDSNEAKLSNEEKGVNAKGESV